MTNALDPTQIRVGGTGAIWKGTSAAAAPTDSTSAWGANWTNLGLVKDGFTAKVDLKTVQINSWQVLDVVRLIRQSLTRSLACELQQTSLAVFQDAWAVTVVPGLAGLYTTTELNPGDDQEFKLGLDWSDGTTTARIYVPRAAYLTLPTAIKVNRSGEVSYAFEALVLKTAGTDSIELLGVDHAVSGV